MNTDQIFELIEMIGKTSSKNEKETLIAANAHFAEFKRVLRYAYDPFMTFGIAKVPPYVVGEGRSQFTDSTWNLLDALAARRLTGNAAREALQNEMDKMTAPSAHLLRRIITKDLRAGFTESTINKAIPGLVPTFDCMLAHSFKEHKHKLKTPLYCEPKLDGVRVLAFVRTDVGARFFSRSGKEFTTFEHLKEPLQRVVQGWLSARGEEANTFLGEHGIVLDAEVVSGSFNKTVSEVRRKDEQATDAKLYVFDLLPMSTFARDEKGGCEKAGTYQHRRALVRSLFNFVRDDDPIRAIPSWKVESEDQIHELYAKVRAKGLEGLIVKQAHGLYHRRRNHAWTKIKAEESVDVQIVDAIEGTGKYAGMLGALVVDFKGTRVNVGTGIDDAQRQSFWTNRSDLIGRLIEVQYHEITPDGSLRHPRFVRFRDDKPLKEAA